MKTMACLIGLYLTTIQQSILRASFFHPKESDCVNLFLALNKLNLNPWLSFCNALGFPITRRWLLEITLLVNHGLSTTLSGITTVVIYSSVRDNHVAFSWTQVCRYMGKCNRTSPYMSLSSSRGVGKARHVSNSLFSGSSTHRRWSPTCYIFQISQILGVASFQL